MWRFGIGFCAVAALFAQTPGFETADVRASARSAIVRDVSGGLMPRSGLYRLRHATMLDLVRLAYGVDAKKVLGGPSWLELDRFDVQARVPAGTTAADVKPMLQTLLVSRFGLVMHHDTKPVEQWVLSSGPRPLLKKADGAGDGACRSAASGDSVEVTCRNVTMAGFVAGLASLDGAWYYVGNNLVADRTGLDGAWDFSLKYSSRQFTSVAGAEIVSLFDAVERLGLRLDVSSVPAAVVVVDQVNRTPTPNSSEAEKAFPPSPTEFEAADVKATDPDYRGGDEFHVDPGGRLRGRGITLKSLIANAWGVTEEMIANAPKFAETDRWDIVAKASGLVAEDGETDSDVLNGMLKTLLAARFRLAAHFEERPVQAYTMTAVKPKMRQADPASRTGCREGPPTLTKVEPRATTPVLGRLLTCTNVSMAYFADLLPVVASGYVHSAVLDATGLEGGWDFTLSFSKVRQLQGNGVAGDGAASDPSGALSAPDAMERQLGLKLELRRRPARVLVIDRIEEKPTDN